jgi:uncharacterized protein YidB (DUF937 family)
MGLLDNIGGLIGDVMAGKQLDIASLAQQALQSEGGLQGILGQLNQSGLGAQVSSWLGSGSNLPISAEQIQAALSSSQLSSLASSLGIDVSQVSGLLAQQLPQAVDEASPDGSLSI